MSENEDHRQGRRFAAGGNGHDGRNPRDVEIERLRQRVRELEINLFDRYERQYEDTPTDTAVEEYENEEILEFEGRVCPDDFLDWLRTVDHIFDLRDTPGHIKVKLVAIQLKKFASLWWDHVQNQRYREGKHRVHSWDKMKRLMKKKFLPVTHKQDSLALKVEKQLSAKQKTTTRFGSSSRAPQLATGPVRCEVIPMDACHVLLGRPWLYDRRVKHDGYRNTYTFKKDGVSITLAPLNLKDAPPDRVLISKTDFVGLVKVSPPSVVFGLLMIKENPVTTAASLSMVSLFNEFKDAFPEEIHAGLLDVKLVKCWSFNVLEPCISYGNYLKLSGPKSRAKCPIRMIPEPGDVNVHATFHEQRDDELSERELKQIEADDQAIQTILLGLPEDIYAAVDSCETAQEIWLRVQQMMKGSDIGIQEKKAKQIAQPGMNMGQDRQMQMVRGNCENQFRQNARNSAGYNDVIGNQNQIENGNLVAVRAEGNAAGHNKNQIRCYNCRGIGHYARNCTARPRRKDAAYLQTQLLIAQKEEAGIQLQAEE
nr:reverse transcriptase domain-containing protein [Tanacetum cinerariifolium]